MGMNTIGADPEFFLYQYEDVEEPEDVEYDEYGDRIFEPYVPAIGIVPGTKAEPYDLGDGYFCHEDNVAVEIGIPPTPSADEFAGHIVEAKRRVHAAFLDDRGLELQCVSTRQFSPSKLAHDQANAFGCEPDYDAYTNGTMRKMPDLSIFGHHRFAGGHIHLGGDFKCPPFVSALFADLYLSLPFYAGGNKVYTPFDGGSRMEWYGRPGIYRPKPYGLEYRTPTNWWCASPQAASAMGSHALRLCRLLSANTPTQLRTMIRKIPWLDVQEYLTNPPRAAAERKEKAMMLCNDIAEEVGLDI